MAATITVRDWFRGARAAHRPRTNEEQQILACVRGDDWLSAEFWLLLWLEQTLRRQRDVRGHLWYLDGYTWRCHDCPADVVSDDIDETEPPDYYDPECRCAACQPCKRSGQ